MGHLLSKNGYRLKKRTSKLHHRKKKRRNCLLQGPCMLCFIIHGNGNSVDDDNGYHPETTTNGVCNGAISVPYVGAVDLSAAAAAAASSKLAGRYAVLASSEDCAKFLLSSRDLALWEGQGRSLLQSTVPAKLIPAPAVFRSAGVSVAVPLPAAGCPGDYPEMVCKRKCSEVQRCTPCKQPRCVFPGAPDGGLENGLGVSAGGGEASTDTGCSDSPACCPHHHEDGHAKTPDTVEALSINHLPSSILLKVLTHLTVKERCLCASLVNDDLLMKIASRRQNVTEINISDCRGVQDHGVCSLASHCPGLQKYTAYRCKQLGDLSLSALASHCPLLVKVHVGNQDKLTDEALKKLGEHCSELKDVHLGQCYSITDQGVVALARGCPKLQRIYMQENKLVSPGGFAVFFALSADSFKETADGAKHTGLVCPSVAID
ncbi:hypothetical protein NHX12_028636 [Muraenolepis orangiensis]|uniref:F-box/LRR-repeat protein 15-like leucin rich repeat domain-containing protein n=1 Tax=Muraenolepis orangiensis TaxID=630683 RepID=A0A9Q0IMQ6_9TELE|nr:hypothetical protein NHX12_028636 [Muraenolepis orangiensis]